MKPRRHIARGFTLIEVLIALTLLALMISIGFATIRSSISATRSGERIIAHTNQVRTAQEFLRRQLANAMPIPFERMEDVGENFVFVADANELRFVAPMPGHLSRGGPHVQWLMLERGAEGYRLLFDHHQLNGYDPDNPKGRDERPPVLVLEGLARARFEYRMLDENGELSEWSSTWEDPQRLPLMVRLVGEYEEDENRLWPDLEIAVMAGSTMPMMFGARPGGRRPELQPQPDPGNRME
ncbi:MAG: prepilin-type N-terminal cleavage/methylation domain-containing protein [Lysobacteraceae bacterium]